MTYENFTFKRFALKIGSSLINMFMFCFNRKVKISHHCLSRTCFSFCKQQQYLVFSKKKTQPTMMAM